MLIYYETPFIALVADLLIAQTCEVHWQAKEEVTMGYIPLFGIKLFDVHALMDNQLLFENQSFQIMSVPHTTTEGAQELGSMCATI